MHRPLLEVRGDDTQLSFFRDIPDVKDETYFIEKLHFPKEFTSQYNFAVDYILGRCKCTFKRTLQIPSNNILSYGIAARMYISEELEEKLDFTSAIRKKVEYMYPSFVDMVEKWLTFIDDYIFYSNNRASLKAVQFVDCVQLNECGVIDYGESAKRLLANSKIGKLDKLKIACVHCLEEEIRGITKSVEFPDFSNNMNEKTAKIMTFWKRYLKDEKYAGDVEALVHLVNYDNEPALKFFWNKLNVGQKCYHLPEVFRNGSSYLHCTWLNEMIPESQLNIMSKCGGPVLMKLRKNFVWGDYYFQVAYFARHVIPTEQYYEVLKDLGCDMLEDYYVGHTKYRTIMHTLWEYAPQRAKQHFYRQKDVAFMFHYLRKIFDFDFVRQVVAAGPPEFKREFFQSEDFFDIISNLPCNEYYDDFNKFYAAAFPRFDDAVEYKIKFVNTEPGTISIVEHSMAEKNKSEFDKMMKKIFFTEEAISKFKKQYLFNSKYLYVLKEFTKNVFYVKGEKGELRKSLKFEELLSMVRWFLSTQQEIDSFKTTRLCFIKEVKEAIFDILEDEAFDLMNQFLKWSFKEDRVVATYKEGLFVDETKKQWYHLITELMRKNNRFVVMTKLANWVHADEEKKNQFRQKIATEFPKMRSLLKYLLFEERFDTTDVFLKWCGVKTNEETVLYKGKLFDEIAWKALLRESPSQFHWDFYEGNQVNMAKCKRILNWLGCAVDGVKKAEFLRKCEANELDCGEDEDDDYTRVCF